MNMLIVTGYMHIEPAHLAAFNRDLQALAVATRQRDGNLFYGIAIDDAARGRLLVAERWRDQAALTAHLHAPDTLAFVDQWGSLMRGEILKYDAANERSLMDE
ncbi:MAG: putative quinol monooxygenase [Roseateles sp.]|uniref:putative quinol monooxygenase n=1 Tax=Roseateles sp. TaxID=1971397 RepID=UPI0039ECA8D8